MRVRKKGIASFTLQYLWTSPVLDRAGELRRNVDLVIAPELMASDPTDSHLSNLPYQNAHKLEHRSPDDITGVWGISHWRSERMFGNVTRTLHPNGTPHSQVSDAVWGEARWFRLLSYHRIHSSIEAIQRVQRKREVRFACEINEDWYDPPNGNIPILGAEPRFKTSHAFALLDYDASQRRFLFPNSWGQEWGSGGFGTFPIENWDRSVVSAWNITTHALSVPTNGEQGIISRGWKLGDRYGDGVHCVEIFDADNDEYLAWAFCIPRNGFLDVDEFFVRPEERGKGYAKALTRLVKRLSVLTKLPIRMVVGFADTEDYAIDGARAVAEMFGVKLVEADERWAAMFGVANAAPRPCRNWKPVRPESIWEKLRPRTEEPVSEPKQYTVFYGTNREPVDPDNLSNGYSNRRGYELRRGSCLVELPKTHKFGGVGKAFLSLLKSAGSDQRRVVGTQGMEFNEFFTFARSWLERSEGDHHNLLFIHGFQNSFNEAAIRAGQLGVDLKIPGATFFYSWPSAESPIGYSADEATIETSVSYCHDFVLEILNEFPDVPLHIVAHSMGNRLAVNLFEKLATAAELPGELGQLIFAAADIDVDRFKQATPTFRGLPKRMTSYVSRGDLAVHLSERLHDFPRLGLAPPVTRVEGVDTILVEGFPVSEFLGHGYFADAAPVLYDMFNLIRHGSDPDNRPLLQRESDSDTAIPFWSLPLS